MSEEIWKVIEDFPEYQISNHGRLRTHRAPICGRRSRKPLPYIIAVNCVNNAGYPIVTNLKKPGETKKHNRTIHRLVAMAFIPNPNNLPVVAHNDGNPANPRWDNLRWTTQQDNQKDMRKHGTMQDGEKCCTAKLTEEQVLELRQRLEIEGRGAGKRLAEEYGISRAQVSRIKNGTRWAYLNE